MAQPAKALEAPTIELAYLHEGVNIPSLGLIVTTTLGGEKMPKGLSLALTPVGIEISGKGQTWVVPLQNVKVYKLKG